MRGTSRAAATALSLLVCLFVARTSSASESDAETISANIRQLHMPYGTVLDPVFNASEPANPDGSPNPDYTAVVGYIRAGDSAIWTGHYLAAEAFRYRVLKSSAVVDFTRLNDALDAVRLALSGVQALVDITGTDVLARSLVPVESPYAEAIRTHEAGHGIYYASLDGRTYFWIGNTSRDQYSGVMFGLSVAYEMVDDPAVRAQAKKLATRIVNYLLRQKWNVVMPNGRTSTTFRFRPDQQLSFLQIARRVNPQKFTRTYRSYRSAYTSQVWMPIAYDNGDTHSSYYKFNLNYINLYNLVRLEESSSTYLATYMSAYQSLRRTTQSHQNAHFNMIDRGLRGADAARDETTLDLLDLWLSRPRRDYWVNLTGEDDESCSDNRAAEPVPVDERVNTDFVWQRSPFQLCGGGDGRVETAGIDYLLPYWMARYYNLPI